MAQMKDETSFINIKIKIQLKCDRSPRLYNNKMKDHKSISINIQK